MLIPNGDDLAWFEVLAATIFILLSIRVIRGRVTVTRTLTLSICLVSALFLLHLYGQAGVAAEERYRIIWPATVLSMAIDIIFLAFVWWAWVNAKRRPGTLARMSLNWLVSFYVVNVWCGGGVWLVGP